MALTRTSTVRFLRLASALAVITVVVMYAIWRSQNYVKGPQLDIHEPKNGSLISSTTVEIKGRAERIDKLTLNGRSITIDLDGNFDETLIIFPGLNVITIIGSDQFGRSTKQELQLVGNAI